MLISYLLVAIILVLFLLTFNSKSAKKRAGFKVLMVLTFALSSLILFNPNLLNKLARFFGVGRGADLVNYLFIIVIAFSIAKLYLEAKEQDDRITKLIREVSIANARKDNDEGTDN